MHDLLGGERIHETKRVDVDRHRARGFADAEIVEGMKRIGTKLDTGPDLAQRRRLFEHQNAAPLLCEPQSGRETADPAAGDGDRPFIPTLRPSRLLAWSGLMFRLPGRQCLRPDGVTTIGAATVRHGLFWASAYDIEPQLFTTPQAGARVRADQT